MTATAEQDETALPHDTDAERVALGAAIEDTRALREVADIITPLDLHHPAHQVIYETALEMHDAGKPLGAVAVNAELTKRGDTARSGGAAYLHTLVEAAPSAASGGYYARIVAEAALKRRIVQAAERIAAMARSGDDAAEVAEHAAVLLEQAAAAGVCAEEDTWRLGDDADFFDALAQPLDGAGLVPTPYADLTEATAGGFKNGELVCVAGRTGAGKSVVGLDIARHAAIRLGLGVLYVSLEMPLDLVRERVYAAEAKVPLHAIKKHTLAESDWDRLAAVRPRITEAPLHVSTPPACTLGVLRQRLATLERRGAPARLLVVDHVGLMSSVGRVENRYAEVSAYTRGLKQLAMSLGIPVVMLCQVNRAAGQRADAIPRLSDLRDSGSLEQDSDVVLIVHREDYDVAEKDKSPRAGEADLYVAKNRSGATCMVTVSSQLHYTRFADMARG